MGNFKINTNDTAYHLKSVFTVTPDGPPGDPRIARIEMWVRDPNGNLIFHDIWEN